MKRSIAAFRQDADGHWVAVLECGHFQHVRHDPPWMMRPWVVTAEGRAAMLGHPLDCKKCDDGEPPDDANVLPTRDRQTTPASPTPASG